jgi:hypothetical protein
LNENALLNTNLKFEDNINLIFAFNFNTHLVKIFSLEKTYQKTSQLMDLFPELKKNIEPGFISSPVFEFQFKKQKSGVKLRVHVMFL